MGFSTSKVYLEDLDTAIKNTVNVNNLKGCSVLITGATGTIGSFLVDMLLRYNKESDANIKIYVAGRSIERLNKLFFQNGSANIIPVLYDMRESITFDFPVDYIVHAAGNAYPAAFNSDPVGTIMGNICGTYNLLEYGRTHRVKRLLYVSSGEVYGQGDLSMDSFSESYGGYVDSTAPRSCYPASKRSAENLCASYSKQFGLNTVIVRPCHTYGPNITSIDNRATVQFMQNILNGEDIVLKSAGTQMRSYSYIADCASALLTVLLNGKMGEAYNLANASARISISGIAQIIARLGNQKVVYANPSMLDIENRTPIEKQILNTKKIEALGWRGAYSVEKGVEHTLTILRGE